MSGTGTARPGGSSAFLSIACPLCSVTEDRERFVLESLRVVTCRRCGLNYINPQPPTAAIEDRYDGSYFESQDPLAWGYQDYAAMRPSLEPGFRKKLAVMRRWAPPPGTLLDVGCAYGFFLDLAQKEGWTVSGIDLSTHAVDRARQLLGSADLRVGQLSDARFSAGSFDSITCWDVIEHTRDPVAFLRETFRLLRPGGHVFLTVPNVGTRHARLLGRYWEGFAKIREHLFYFTPSTADRALRLAGFERLHLQSSGPSITLDFLMSKMARYSDAVSRTARAVLRAARMQEVVVGFPFIDLLAVGRKPSA